MRLIICVFLIVIQNFVCPTEKHSLTYFLTASSGLQTFPEFVVVSMVDGVQVAYCDSNNKRAEFKQDWVKKLVKDDPKHAEWHTETCMFVHLDLKSELIDLKQRKTGGMFIFNF